LTKRKTAGIRVPDHPICIALVQSLGNPIISTSATTPDGSVFDNASLIHEYYGSRLDVVIDAGAVSGNPSSVISLIDDTPEIIRKGAGDLSAFNP
jgi:tRNA threonylcarbamoyl adenosine modification protein (Sua5/YciO/YrdC/YwlC family)